METSFPLYLIPLLPLLGAAINLLFGKRLGKGAVSLIACGAIGAAALVATKAVLTLAGQAIPGGALVDRFFAGDWILATGDGPGQDLHLAAGLLLDRLSAVMVMVVTWIALLIHIYATGYMEHDEGYTRFFGYLNLFCGAMLILVLGDSLPMTFIGWEGVGLCSYLLIGFWHHEDKNATAGRKAFIVNRIGDFGFLLGMCLLFALAGTLKYTEIGAQMGTLRQALWLGWPATYFIAVLLFIGCTGKSAQIPLYVWLPDAMAGPTPVSALIHAATMVTAGVYVVARTHVLFDVMPTSAKMLVAGIGALTALFAATIGIVQKDFKRVLAYSTVSQLGFMFVGVGTGAYAAGIFHLMTHAFFKAGLFLGAGSVMHAMNGEGDISKMGGLGKYMPFTRWTFFIYCLAIAGIVPFAGFFSKDAVLTGAWGASFVIPPGAVLMLFGKQILSAEALHSLAVVVFPKVLWATLVLAAMCTAFYMWRLYFVVFTGRFRGGHELEHHLHESPPEMTGPLVLLAVGSVLVGFLGIPAVMGHDMDKFGAWLSPIVPSMTAEISHATEWLLMGVALMVSVAGIALAYSLYYGGFSSTAKNIAGALSGLHKVVFNKYYVDEIYHFLFVRPLKGLAVFLWKTVDAFLIDKVLVHLGAFVINAVSKISRYLQNGDVQRYVVGVLLGTSLILAITTNWITVRAVDFKVTVDGRKITLDAGQGDPPRGVLYRVDYNGDGKWEEVDTRFPNLTYTYQDKGTYKIVMEARDPRWGTTSSKTKQVEIK